LRERRPDIPLLVSFFINKFSTVMNKPTKKVSKEAMEFLTNHDWPGNVRELENAIERAMVVGKTNSITVDDLPFHLSNNNFEFNSDQKSLASIERNYILKILNENSWNISKTAQMLEIDRATLYNKISKYSLRKAE
jgi:DNA-binding NtrC family response regulator